MLQKRRMYTIQEGEYVKQLLINLLHSPLHKSLEEFERYSLENAQASLQAHYYEYRRRYVVVALVVTGSNKIF